MVNNIAKRAIVFEKDEMDKLWHLIVKTYLKNRNQTLDLSFKGASQRIWTEKGDLIYNDFHAATNFNKSLISLGGNTSTEKEISKQYFYKHLIGQSVLSIKYEYLQRIVFYLNKNKKTDPLVFLESNGFHFKDSQLSSLPSGLDYLTGSWIGINRNLEEGKFAICYYEFKPEATKMLVLREAYSSELLYEGEAILQNDSTYMIHLVGRSRG